ncbi:MAG: bile acid:sodium symporter [Comamonas sp.]|nr:bile acid:sodium symporter [Comamonas sp.]
MSFTKYLPDRFTCLLMGAVIVASFFPARGSVSEVLSYLASGVIFLLFFLHGIKLSRPAIWEGIGHWRLHLLVTAMTFAFFPVVGWALQPVLEPAFGHELYMGVLFLCAVPATVQSAITLTALAKGNMPAAICSASGSTLMGILLTPLLVGVLMRIQVASGSEGMLHSIGKIAVQLFLPFLLGHLLRPWLAPVLQKHAKPVKALDQSAILLVVYSAFSGAVLGGIWDKVPLPNLLMLIALCAVILALSMGMCVLASRRLGFSTEDEVAVLFCGAQKSLVSGVPMAKVMFAAPAVGLMILPLMIYHPMQLMVSAVVAGRYGRRASKPAQP